MKRVLNIVMVLGLVSSQMMAFKSSGSLTPVKPVEEVVISHVEEPATGVVTTVIEKATSAFDSIGTWMKKYPKISTAIGLVTTAAAALAYAKNGAFTHTDKDGNFTLMPQWNTGKGIEQLYTENGIFVAGKELKAWYKDRAAAKELTIDQKNELAKLNEAVVEKTIQAAVSILKKMFTLEAKNKEELDALIFELDKVAQNKDLRTSDKVKNLNPEALAALLFNEMDEAITGSWIDGKKNVTVVPHIRFAPVPVKEASAEHN